MKRTVLLILAAAFLISAIGTGSLYTYRLMSAKEQDTLRVAESDPAIGKIPHYLALKKNFYRDQKVTVKTVEVRDDQDALAALESGRADVALVRPSNLIYRKASYLREGKGPVAFASLDRGTSYHLLARENKPLDKIQSLKDKTVIAGPQDSMETVFLENALRDAGISPYDSVTIITNIPEEVRIGALKAGTGHYLLAGEEVLQATAARELFRVMSLKTDFPTAVCVATPEFARDHRQSLQKFTNALYMAQTWLNHRTAADATAALGSVRGIAKESLPGLVARYYENKALPDSPVPQGKSIETVVKMMDRAREIPMPVSSADLISGTFAENSVKTVKYVPPPPEREGGLLNKIRFWE